MQESIQKVEEKDTSFRNAVAQYFEDSKSISMAIGIYINISCRARVQDGYEGDWGFGQQGRNSQQSVEREEIKLGY